MSTSILSTKGRLVIPKEVRELLGLEAGDRIDFYVEADGRVSIGPALLDFRELLDEGRRRPASVERMNRAVRERAGDP